MSESLAGSSTGKFLSKGVRAFTPSRSGPLLAAAAMAICFASPGAKAASETPLKYVQYGMADPVFQSLWGDQAADLVANPGDYERPTAFVARTRDVDGKEVVVTMLRAREACGLQLCPVRVMTGDGRKVVAGGLAQMAVTDHRLSEDGRSVVFGVEEMKKDPGLWGNYSLRLDGRGEAVPAVSLAMSGVPPRASGPALRSLPKLDAVMADPFAPGVRMKLPSGF